MQEKIKWILNNFESFSNIVQRQNIAFAGLLAFFTPIWIESNDDRQRGWGNILVIGDTTTGKSETIRKLIRLLGAGIYITAETASVVGFSAAAIQIKGGEWFSDFGILVQCDRRLIAIDGAQKLSSKEWAYFAESERSGVITIVKAAKGSAPAKTRQIKIANRARAGVWL